MDTNRDLQPNIVGSKTTSSPTAPDLRQTVREPIDQMRAHTRRRRAKRPSTIRSAVPAPNCPAQKHVLTFHPWPQEQITIDCVEYDVVDITEDPAARDYVMSLGYLQAPVVIAGEQHWSGFRPDAIKSLSAA